MFDFKVNINEDREFRILQLTDFQPIDPTQKRYPERLCEKDSIPLTNEEKYRRLYYFIEKSIKDTNPDLIIVTGDQVYGEFDDNGSMFLEIINYLNSFNIPWAPVYGNHEAESKMGVAWQCKQYESMSNCLFKRRELSGNGNYNIGIYRSNKLIRVLYMLDSNGCGHGKHYTYAKDYPPYNLNERIIEVPGIFEDQIKWVDKSCNEIDETFDVKKLIAFHIPPSIIRQAAFEKEYQDDDSWGNQETFTPGVTVPSLDGDFGTKGERYCDCPTKNLWNILKKHQFTNLFVGHCHKNSLVMMTYGIRISFGIKTGLYDYHDKVGSTLIKITPENEIEIKHNFIDEI